MDLLTPQQIDALDTPRAPRALSPDEIDAIESGQMAPRPTGGQLEFERGIKEPSLSQGIYSTLGYLGNLIKGTTQDIAEKVSGYTGPESDRLKPVQAYEPFRNVIAARSGDETPYDIETKDVKGFPGVLKRFSEGTSEMLPKIAASHAIGGGAVGAGLAFGGDEKEGFQPKEAAKMAGFGLVSEIGGAALLKQLGKWGVDINRLSEPAHNALQAAGSAAASQAYMAALASPYYLDANVTPEQKKERFIDDLAMNLGFHAMQIPGIAQSIGDEMKLRKSIRDDADITALLNSSRWVAPGTESRQIAPPAKRNRMRVTLPQPRDQNATEQEQQQEGVGTQLPRTEARQDVPTDTTEVRPEEGAEANAGNRPVEPTPQPDAGTVIPPVPKPVDLHGPPQPDWRVVVKQPDAQDPTSYVQIVDKAAGSGPPPTVESLRAAGHEVPDFSKLPQGNYTWEQAAKLAAQPTSEPPYIPPGVKLPEPPKPETPPVELAKPTLSPDKHWLFNSKSGDIASTPNGGNIFIVRHFDKLKDARAAAAKINEVTGNESAKVESWMAKPKKEGGKVVNQYSVYIPNVSQGFADQMNKLLAEGEKTVQASSEEEKTSSLPVETPTPVESTKPPEQPAAKKFTDVLNDADKQRLADLHAELRKKLGQVGTGVDPTIIVVAGEMAGLYAKAGVKQFAAFARQVKQDLPDIWDKLKPHLKSIWEAAAIHDSGLDEPSRAQAAQAIQEIDAETGKATHDDERGTGTVGGGRSGGAEPAVTGGTGADKPVDTSVTGQDQPVQPGVRPPNEGRKPGGRFRSGRVPPANAGNIPKEPGPTPIDTGAGTAGAATGGQVPGHATPNDPAPDKELTNPGAAKNIRLVENPAPTGLTARVKSNIDAIRLLKTLEQTGKFPTDDDRKSLAAWSGWGSFKELFNEGRAEKRDWDVSWMSRYGKAYDQLRELLTPEEFNAAAESSVNAHYTSKEVVGAMWNLVTRLGYKGGRALEPATGSGLFLGYAPDHIASTTRWTGVELDPITGRIFSYLYPEADVRIQGFEKAKLPNGFYDLAISNVPFHEVGPGGEYPDLNLHNYFIARMLDKVKPGGLVVAITTNHTMDSRAEQRRFLSEKGHLIGAIRLPNNAFKASAGTEVVTDIIVMMKPSDRPFDQVQDWKNVTDVNTPQGIAKINEYFANHPEMVLGKNALTGTMYRKDSYTVEGSGNLEQKLAEAIARLPEGVISEPTIKTPEYTSTRLEDFSLILSDGQVMESRNFQLQLPQWDSTNDTLVSRAKGYIALRDLLRNQYALEANPDATDAQIESNRTKLKDAYQKLYRRVGGPLNSNKRKLEHLSNDPDFYTVMGTEIRKEVADPENAGNTVTIVEPADILSKRVSQPDRPPTHVDSPVDALAVSLSYRGRLDMDYLKELTGQSEEQIESQLIASGQGFKDPASGKFVTNQDYLTGDVREKLQKAIFAAKESDVFARNVEALKGVIPVDVPFEKIRYDISGRWIPSSVISGFAHEVMGLAPDSVSFVSGVEQFAVDKSKNYSMSANTRASWGTLNLSPVELLDHALNFKRAKIMMEVEKGKYREDVDASALNNQIIDKIKYEFSKWSRTTQRGVSYRWFDGDRGEYRNEEIPVWDIMQREFNRTKNSFVVPDTDGSMLKLPGLSNAVRRTPHLVNGVMRSITSGNAVFAHGTGSGKTFLLTTISHELKRIGLMKKDVIVVKKSTVAQYRDSIQKAYPGSRILIPSKEDFEMANRRTMAARIASGKWDFIVLTHEQFKAIKTSEESVESFFNDQIDQLRQILRDIGAPADAENSKSTRGMDSAVRNIVKKIKSLRKRLDAHATAISKAQDTGLNWEGMGIDGVLIDESHNFKKMPIPTQMDNVKGIPVDFSQRAVDLLIKIRGIQKKTGGRNVFFASGTPVSNTLAELWVMFHATAPELLDKFKISTFDSFASAYADVVSNFELGWDNKFKDVTRMSRFKNGASLTMLTRMGMDVRIGNKELGLDVPELAGGKPSVVVTKPTAAFERWLTLLEDVSGEWDGLDAKGRFENSWVPIATMRAGVAAALDPRAVFPDAPDDPASKVNTAVRDVIKEYEAGKAKRTTMMIFADMYRTINTDKLMGFLGRETLRPTMEIEASPEDSGGDDTGDTGASDASAFEQTAVGQFNLYDDIRRKLIKAGVPENEIAVITEHDSDIKRETLFNKVRSGAVRILIGSTEKIGEGVDVPQRMSAQFHLDPPMAMNPAKMEQRIGRIIRQGNLHSPKNWNIPVRIYMYAQERSMDAAIYQMLETKSAMVLQALKGQYLGDSFEDPAGELTLAMAEMKSAATGDSRVLDMARLTKTVRELNMEEGAYYRGMSQLRSLADSASRQSQNSKRDAINYREIAKASELAMADPATTVLTAAGKKILGKEAIDAWLERAHAEFEKNLTKKGQEITLKFRLGNDLNVQVVGYVPQYMEGIQLKYRGTFYLGSDITWVVPRWDSDLNSVESVYNVAKGIARHATSNAESSEITAKKRADEAAAYASKISDARFEKEGELREARGKLDALTSELRGESQAKKQAAQERRRQREQPGEPEQGGESDRQGSIGNQDVKKLSSHDQQNLNYEDRIYYHGLSGTRLEEFRKTGSIPKARQAFGGDYSITDDYGLAKSHAGKDGVVIALKIDPKSRVEQRDPFGEESTGADIEDSGEGEFLVNNPDRIKISGEVGSTIGKKIDVDKIPQEGGVDESGYEVIPKDDNPLNYGPEEAKYYLSPDGRWIWVEEHENVAATLLGKDAVPHNSRDVNPNQAKLEQEYKWLRVVETNEGLHFSGDTTATQLRELKNVAIENGKPLIKYVGGKDRVVFDPEREGSISGEADTERLTNKGAKSLAEPTNRIVVEGVDEFRNVINSREFGLPENARQVWNAILDSPAMRKLDWSRLNAIIDPQYDLPGAAHIKQSLIFIGSNPDATTLPHEIFHFLHEFLPKDYQQELESLRLAELTKKFGTNLPIDLLNGTMSTDDFLKSGLSPDLYPYINASEYLATFAGEKFAREAFEGRNAGKLEQIYNAARGAVKAIVNAVRRFFKVRPDLQRIFDELLNGTWKPTPEGGAEFEDRQGQLPRSAREYARQEAFEERAIPERTMGAYGDLTAIKLKAADTVKASPEARRAVLLPQQELLVALSEADLAGPRLVFGNYSAMRARTEGSDMGLRSSVILDAFHGLGWEQRRMITLRDKLAASEKAITAQSFVEKLFRTLGAKQKSDMLEDASRTFRNQISQQAGDIIKELQQRGRTEAEYDALRQTLARVEGLKEYNSAVAQRVQDIIDVVSKTEGGLELLMSGGTSGQEISRRYQDIKETIEQQHKPWTPASMLSDYDRQFLSESERQRLESNLPVFDENSKMFINLAAQVLSANADLRIRLATAAHYQIDPVFKAKVDDIGEKFRKQFVADPKNAVAQLTKTVAKLEGDARDAETSYLRLNKEVQPELKRHRTLKEAVAIDDATVASPDWKELVNQIHRDAGAVRIPDSEIKEVTAGNVFNEFTGNQNLRSPYGTKYEINLGYTKADSALAQERMNGYLSEVSRWLAENPDSPDRKYWNMRYDFIDAALNVSTALNPTSTRGLIVKSPWTMMEFLFKSATLPDMKVAFTASNNLNRAWVIADQWYNGVEPQWRARLDRAARSHNYDPNFQIKEYREDVLDRLAAAYRKGQALEAGDKLNNGTVLTQQDMFAFKYMGESVSALFNQQKNMGREKVMVDGLMIDDWAKNVFGIRAPQELGAAPGTTLPHEFSGRAKSLATLIANAKNGDEILKILDQEQNFKSFVQRFISERSAEYSVQTPFEAQYKQLAENFENGVGPQSIKEVVDYIEQNSTLSRDEIANTFIGEMVAQLKKFYKDYVAKEEATDVRALRASKQSAFTSGHTRDIGSSFYYDYGAVTSQEIRSLGIDSSNFHLVRFVKSLDSALTAYDKALSEYNLVPQSGRRKFTEESMARYRSGEDFRNYETLQSERSSVKWLRDNIGSAYGSQQVKTVELFSNAGRLVGDFVGGALTGLTTVARVTVGSTVKMGLVTGRIQRWYLGAYAKGAVSTIMSALKMAAQTPLVLGKIKKGYQSGENFWAATANALQEGIEGAFRQGKYFNQQYQYGLGFKQPVGYRIYNILSQPYTHGRGYDVKLSNAKLIAMGQKAFFRMLSMAEAPLELVRSVFPQLEYAVSYDAAARAGSWTIDGIGSQARRSFEYLEKSGGLAAYDLDNPSSLTNVLPADYILPTGIFKKSQSELNLARDWWQRALDKPLNETVISYWKRLSETPPDKRGEVSFLASDQSPERVKQLEEARAGALLGVLLKDIHHASPENRPMQLRVDPMMRFMFPMVGWTLHSLRTTAQNLGFDPRDPRSAQMKMAYSASLLLSFIAGTILLGETEKDIRKVIAEQINGEVFPERTLDEARNVKDAGKMALIDSVAWVPMAQNIASSLLGESSQTISDTGLNMFSVQKAQSLLRYFKGVIATHDWSYGLPQLARGLLPGGRPLVAMLSSQEGLLKQKGARTIVEKYGPEDLIGKEEPPQFRTPTELTPFKQRLANAIFKGDTSEITQRIQEFREKAESMGGDSQQLLERAMSSINPITVGGRKLTPQQYADVLTEAGDRYGKQLKQAQDNWELANRMIGGTASITKQPVGARASAGSSGGVARGASYGFRGRTRSRGGMRAPRLRVSRSRRSRSSSMRSRGTRSRYRRRAVYA